MASGYNKASPYAATKVINGYLDILNFIDIPAKDNDVQFTITNYYSHRPDLLSYDVYGTPSLWWVFAVRNKDIIQDSVFDFIPGQTIFLPQLTTINQAIGA